MDTVSFTDFRTNLAQHLDATSDNRAPMMVTRSAGKGNVVLIDADEYSAMVETLHLLNNPANTRRLLDAIDNANKGKLVECELVSPPVLKEKSNAKKKFATA